MKIVSLMCNHCGAPLEVSAKARFVTCGFCEAKLAVEHTGSSYSTAVLDDIKETTRQIAQDVADLKSNTAIQHLDAEWARTRAHHLVTRNNGSHALPTKGGAIAIGTIGVVFGLFWMTVAGGIVSSASRMGAPRAIGLFPLFGLVFIAAAVFVAFSIFKKAEAYRRDLTEFQARRRDLTDGER